MKRWLSCMIFVLLSASVFVSGAHANSGESAEDCVDVSANDSSGKIKIKNTCTEKIFVIWCLATPNETAQFRCGPKAGSASFYVDTLNLVAGGEVSWTLAGDLHYAACKGSVGVGEPSSGYYKDDGKGGFKCTVTRDREVKLTITDNSAKLLEEEKAKAEADRKMAMDNKVKTQAALAARQASAAKAKAMEAEREEKTKARCMAEKNYDCSCMKYREHKGPACQK